MDDTIRTFLIILVLAAAVAAALLALIWLTPQGDIEARAPVVTVSEKLEPEQEPEIRTISWPSAQQVSEPTASPEAAQ